MSLAPYIRLARPGYWINNIFILPGILLAWFYDPHLRAPRLWGGLLLTLMAACLTASSNYVLNEILDARRDAFHPQKRHRPLVRSEASRAVAFGEWLLLAAVGLGLATAVSRRLGVAMLAFWGAAILYNTPPVRLKDRPYADVLSESVNNPLRMAIGWYGAGFGSMPPLSILLAYWAFGAFLMTIKRYAEYRVIGDSGAAAAYRSAFRYYSAERLLECTFFYAAMFGLLSGYFIARYHVEVVLATPLIAWAMAYYLHLGFRPNSPVQHPELLYRQRKLVLLVALAFAACAVLLFVRIPAFERLLLPWQQPPHPPLPNQ